MRKASWATHNQQESRERQKKWRDENLFGLQDKETNGPVNQQNRRTHFEAGLGPLFHSTKGQYAERNHHAEGNAQKFHGLRDSADCGTRFTSSTQAVPEIFAFGVSLGSRMTQIAAWRTLGPAVHGVSILVQGFVPWISRVWLTVDSGSPCGRIRKPMPLLVVRSLGPDPTGKMISGVRLDIHYCASRLQI